MRASKLILIAVPLLTAGLFAQTVQPIPASTSAQQPAVVPVSAPSTSTQPANVPTAPQPAPVQPAPAASTQPVPTTLDQVADR